MPCLALKAEHAKQYRPRYHVSEATNFRHSNLDMQFMRQKALLSNTSASHLLVVTIGPVEQVAGYCDGEDSVGVMLRNTGDHGNTLARRTSQDVEGYARKVPRGDSKYDSVFPCSRTNDPSLVPPSSQHAFLTTLQIFRA